MADSMTNVKAKIEQKLSAGRITRAQAIRCKCLECSCYQPSEVTKCPVKTCALYRYRMGREENIA